MFGNPQELRERRISLAIVYSFITFGLYLLYWIYQMQRETNLLMGLRNETGPGRVVLFAVLTGGIYLVYWAYRQGLKFRQEARNRGSNEADQCPSLYLVLQLVNYLAGVTSIVNLALMQDRLNQLLRMRGMGRRAYDPDRFRHTPEQDIVRAARQRAQAYEAEIAGDQQLQDALEGRRQQLFLKNPDEDEKL